MNVSVRELRRQVEQSKFTFRDGSALLPECSIIKEKAVSQRANSSKQPGIASSSHVSGNGASSEASFDHHTPSTSTHADMLVQRLAAKHKEAGKQIRKIYREQFESVHYKEECLKYQSERLQRSLRVRVPLEAHQPARLKSVLYPAGLDASQASRFGDDYKGNLEVLTMPTGDCGFNLTLQKEQLIKKFSRSVRPSRPIVVEPAALPATGVSSKADLPSQRSKQLSQKVEPTNSRQASAKNLEEQAEPTDDAPKESRSVLKSEVTAR